MDNPGLEAAERPTVATTYQDPGGPERYVTVVEGASDVLESLVPLEGDRSAGATAGSLAEFEPRSGRTRPVVAVAAPDGDGLWSRVVIGSDGSAAGLRSAAVAAEGSGAEFGGEVVGVSVGHGIYVHIYQRPTDQIQVLRTFLGSNRATLQFLEDRIIFSDGVRGLIQRAGYRVADFDYFFDPHTAQVNDFGQALTNVRNTSRCLVMHRNPANYLPGADRHNWTYRSAGGDCRVGRDFPLG